MKLRNLANRFLLVVVLVVFAWSNFATSSVLSSLSLSVSTAEALSAKTYYFDAYNQNKPTGESLYEALGIKVYNDYLTALSETKDLNEVIIAVVDTGVDADYPVFAGRILEEYAMDFSAGLPTTLSNHWNVDQNGHGTHVAALIADITPANVKILPIKIFSGVNNSSSGYAFENAVSWICALKGGYKTHLLNNSGTATTQYYNEAEVKLDNIVAVNLSLGTSGFSLSSSKDLQEYKIEKYGYTENGIVYTGYQYVIDKLLKSEVLPIVAAGNRESESEYNGKPYYSLPGACDGVLEVSAYDNTDDEYALASFSYYNDFVGIAAPGTRIWSACSDDIVDLLSSRYTQKKEETAEYTRYDYEKGSVTATWYIKEDNGLYYLRESGTSMATPYVSACYALLLSDSSKAAAEDYGLTSWDPDDKDADFMNIAHKALLAAAATDGYHSDEGYEMKFGYGTVSVGGFVPDSETNAVRPLVNINYETKASTTKDDVDLQNTTGTTAAEDVDWFSVCVVLGVLVLAIWGVSQIKAFVLRRRINEDEENN